MTLLASLNDVTVHFPIYSLRSRSIKRAMIDMTTGGKISNSNSGVVVVESLSHLSFDLHEGDRVGIIGHNGAGKTTLLRVLGGVYEPTYGEISMYGSTTALFDLALGMEGEFTGYENITLRGLFAGMTLDEIENRTPDIIEFSGLGDYLQMPLRTYSSGMILRLAFAVAACRQSDIIIMDEWISTLDEEFMRKVRNRLMEMAGQSKVLVMASHQMDLVRSMCNKIMVMEHGRLKAFGPIDEILAQYKPEKAA